MRAKCFSLINTLALYAVSLLGAAYGVDCIIHTAVSAVLPRGCMLFEPCPAEAAVRFGMHERTTTHIVSSNGEPNRGCGSGDGATPRGYAPHDVIYEGRVSVRHASEMVLPRAVKIPGLNYGCEQ